MALKPSVSLHSGCVIFRERLLLFVAPSGSGKSSMSLAAVREHGEYVTDDFLVLSEGHGFGLARAIRFKSIPADDTVRSDYLQGMDLSSYSVMSRGERRIVPLFAGSMRTRHRVDFSQLPPADCGARGSR